MKPNHGWQIWIDRGGTFTDIVALDPSGNVRTVKLLSEDPQQYLDAAVEGIRRILGLNADEKIPHDQINAIHMGTTVATNALLERKGARTLLVTTKGFKDQLRIGYQHRPKLFVKQILLNRLPYEEVLEVAERRGAKGEHLEQFEPERVLADLIAARKRGLESCAVHFMHGYKFPAHERSVAELARQAGFTQVSTGHEVSPLMKFVSRGHTTLADAYLTPILKRYVSQVDNALGQFSESGRLQFMRSSGALTSASRFSGKDAILSGPAGGVIGMAVTAARAGFPHVIGFDMGGTSTDVSRFDGQYQFSFETEIDQLRLRTPMLAVHTVAAGGGSILFYENARMRVGPESAGANPGPASYRRGGPLTVTDANVLTGRIQPNFFPASFGPNADQPIDQDIVRDKFALWSRELKKQPEDLAEGFLNIAVANMAEAIKRISIAQGADVSEYALQCFGGAGAQLACRVAEALSMTEILIHPLAGVLSAFGMGLAQIQSRRECAVERTLNQQTLDEITLKAAELTSDAEMELREHQSLQENCQIRTLLHLKYKGTDTTIPVPFGTLNEIADDFATRHRKQFGFWDASRELIVESLAVDAEIKQDLPALPARKPKREGRPLHPISVTSLYLDGAWREANIYHRDHMDPGDKLTGPALVIEPNSTIVIDRDWQAEFHADGNLVLERTAAAQINTISAQADPVRVEIFNALFMSIAEQMGATLEKTASSVNIKERLDFSCAIFDARGDLIANAPHMPVHLGSMGQSVRAVIDAQDCTFRAGDAFALNAPYAGGTHLPDITVVMPVFFGKEIAPAFFTAARGHHADIGGISPGSMPPNSTHVDEEGVLFSGERIMAGAIFDEAGVRQRLANHVHPARNPDQNIADLKAQIAACVKGAQELVNLCAHYGREIVSVYMEHVQDNAEEQVRQVICALDDGRFEHQMDDGAKICVSVSVDRKARSATIDFSGTSGERPTNFNAPYSVTVAAVLYVFRCLVDSEIPLNAGCLRPLQIIVPERCFLNPRYPAAVVAGNVETSQAVTDTLFAALGILAASQGSMNNFTFGNEAHQYYETICGGAGAGAGFAGASAVHTHMTNSRLTDPEVLEWRFPVRLKEFSIRKGSGGSGRWTGGDGVVRQVKFLEPMQAGILSTRRKTAPFGLKGGGPAQLGRNTVIRKSTGQTTAIEGCATCNMEPGDIFVIETPGGGGYGST